MIPQPLQVPRSTPSCWESRPTFTGKAITFFFFTLLSLSCSRSSLSNDFFLERSRLPSVLLVLEVNNRDLTLELEPSLWGDSLKVPRFMRPESKSVNDLSREGDLDLSLDSDFSLVSIEVIVNFFLLKVVWTRIRSSNLKNSNESLFFSYLFDFLFMKLCSLPPELSLRENLLPPF